MSSYVSSGIWEVDFLFLKGVFNICLISSMEGTFSKSCTVFSFFKLLLGFAEFGKVQGCNFLSLLNLLLVSLDLLLKLGGKFRHTVLILLVLIILELELLDLTLSLLVCLHIVSSVSLNSSQLDFKLANTGLKLCHGILATTHGTFVGISKAILHFTHLSFK